MSAERESELFQALVLQLGQAGWMALGKIPNPVSGTIERSLEMARFTIDTLGALETRTRGQLLAEEKTLLERTLRELRMNYVDETRKEPAGAGPAATSPAATSPTATSPAPSGPAASDPAAAGPAKPEGEPHAGD
jgi:hypothetical protein